MSENFPALFAALLLVLGGIWLGGRALRRTVRRHRLRQRQIPPGWEELLWERMALYRRLPPARRAELHGHIQVLLDEKHFEGCGGLRLEDEHRLLIAALAGLLLLGRKTARYFPRLESILVYPTTYLASTVDQRSGVVLEYQQVRAGESWQHGFVVLAWDEIERALEERPRGENVVLHEFAHQLDQEDGVADGTPPLPSRAQYRCWSTVFSREFRALRRALRKAEPHVINPYGAQNEAEFFAVVVELYFEQPQLLRSSHPQLYQIVDRYFDLAPHQWREDGSHQPLRR